MPALALQVALLGACSLDDEPDGACEKPLALSLTLTLDAAGWPEIAVEGEVAAAGLASSRPVEGTLRVAGRELTLRLAFESDDGVPCRLVGSTELRTAGVPPAFTRLDAELVAGERRGRAHLRFDVRSSLSRTLRSMRLVRRGTVP